jgi:NADPH-dependent 2,4-dienoyl-CoA reductase/sulfur reductase-like enzyme
MSTGVAVLGAGPYGLSAAAHLGRAGVETRVFGKTMAFWRERMPSGMLLRSGWQASHIADPARELTLDAYEAAQGRRLERPVPLTDFVNYGEWYRDRAGIEPDPRLVERLSRANGHFALRLDDGETVEAGSVVVATGLDRFEWRPPQFAALPSELVSHSSEHSSLAQFAGGRVAVVGSGQSATESAALLHEAGAEVELVLRRPELQWLSGGRLGSRPRLHSLLYPPTDVGPPGLNWIVAAPGLFRTFPTSLRKPISTRVLRPAAADWLQPRLNGVILNAGRTIVTAQQNEHGCELVLDDGATREVDHVLLATGFRVDLRRLPLLENVVDQIRLSDGSPVLREGYESSLPGLHFVGASATYSFGPLMRFVAGTGYAARSVTRRITGKRAS